MSNKVNVVSAVISPKQRLLVLEKFTPRYTNVYAFHLTWAYRVTPEFEFPRGEIALVLDGYHCGDGADAATGYLHDGNTLFTERVRPDGGLVHVTLSASDGTEPRAAGNIRLKDIVRLGDPLRLQVALVRRHATKLTPERRELA